MRIIGFSISSLILKAKEKKMAGKRDFVGKWPFWDGVGPKRQ